MSDQTAPISSPGATRVVRRTHPVSIIFESLAIGPRDAILFLFLIVSTGYWWLLLVGLVLALAASTLRWWKMTWSFDGTTVVVDKGVLQRSRREIPVNRIQQVELIRKLRHQILGMTTVRIETSGGSAHSEIELAVVPAGEAEGIRSVLLDARDRARLAGPLQTMSGGVQPAPDLATSAPGDSPPVPTTRLIELPLRRLVVAGLTGPQLLALPLAVAWFLNLAGDLPDEVTPEVDASGAQAGGLLIVALLVIGVLVLWIGVAVIAGLLAYHGLEVTLVGQDLRVRRGLFEKRDVSIPIGRIQAVQLTAHPVHRLLGLADVRISSAGQRAGSSPNDTAQAVIPVLDADEISSLLKVILPEAVPLPELQPAPRRAMSRQLLQPVLTMAVVAAVAIAVVPPWGYFALVLVGLGLWRGVLVYRGLGASGLGPIIATRRGALVRRTHLVPVRKLQSVRRRSSYFQRRRQLATLGLDIGGQREAPQLVDRDADEVEALFEALTHSEAPRRDDAVLRHFHDSAAHDAPADVDVDPGNWVGAARNPVA